MAGRYRLVVHPTCASSRSLLHGLRERGLLDRVELVVAYTPGAAGGLVVWSVPLLVSPSGEPLAMDPLGVEEAEVLLSGGVPGPRGGLEDEFLEAVLYSSYASALALVHGSLEPLARDPTFLAPALRAIPRRLDLEDASRRLASAAGRLYSENWETIARAATLSYARTLYWVHGRDALEERLSKSTPDDVAEWLLASASMGRTGLPPRPGRPRAAEYIAGFARRRARGLARKIIREQEELARDPLFRELLGV